MIWLILASVACLVSSFFDGVRDSGVSRWAGWWPWHRVKWIAFYTPLLLVLSVCWKLSGYPWTGFIFWVPALALACYLVWRAGYEKGASWFFNK